VPQFLLQRSKNGGRAEVLGKKKKRGSHSKEVFFNNEAAKLPMLRVLSKVPK
jgi:hypothetical protein